MFGELHDGLDRADLVIDRLTKERDEAMAVAETAEARASKCGTALGKLAERYNALLAERDDLIENMLELNEARAVARVAFGYWRFHQECGAPPGCGPDQRLIDAILSASPWLEESDG